MANIPLWRQAKAIWSLRGEHRNHIWQNMIYDAYPLAFRLPLHDRYYACKFAGITPTLTMFLAWYLYVVSTLIQEKPGHLNILWLQLRDLDSKFLVKLINRRESFKAYFGWRHVFNQEQWKE